MEYQDQGLNSDNINALWLKNIFESLKNLEVMERNAREGCQSIFEYLEMPPEYRMMNFADVQYKNLKFMVTEFSILIGKLHPILLDDDVTKLTAINKRLLKIINRRDIFVKAIRKNDISYSENTPAFYEVLDLLSSQIFGIIKKIEHLLYIKEDTKKKW